MDINIDSKEYHERVDKTIHEITSMIKAHQLHPRKPHKAVRKANNNNLFFIHPLWCAITILFEAKLPDDLKREGYLALLYHDVLEDTTQQPPKELSSKIKEYVEHLTIEGGSKEEIKTIWSKPKEIRLFKLYDKINNYLDDRWLNEEKKEFYESYISQLADDVEKNFGTLRIVSIARALIPRNNT